MRISGGLQDQGIVVGNTYDKYGSRNPIVRHIMRGFHNTLESLVAKAAPQTIHEIGCGEGYWVIKWRQNGLAARGSDFSERVIGLARENAMQRGLTGDCFNVGSIYDVQPGRDSADLVVCCEVLEHLEDPSAGLQALRRIVTSHLIVSVPREPIWCAMNVARGKYVTQWGNTPGHVQHWSRRSFVAFVGRHFDVVDVRSPLPWTMLLVRARR